MHCFPRQDDAKKPKMLERKRNNVVLEWENKNGTENCTIYRWQIFNDFKEWKTIYCGRKNQLKVENLAPCTCYSFRIRPELDDPPEWTYFKAATEDEGPYCSVMHMSRAVKLGKMPFVRKIAHTRPHLLETENKGNKTPLVQAIQAGDAQMLQLLISLGSNVNRPLFFNKRTPLMVAVYEGNLQIASLLIDKGADEKATDINGLNVLHHAVDSNKEESVRFCLRILKDLDCQDNNGWTALMRAAILGASEEIINLLLEKGAATNLRDKNGLDYNDHKKLTLDVKKMSC